MKLYKENKEVVDATLAGKIVEGYDKSWADMFGGVVGFSIVLVLAFVLWIWALVVTIKYWHQLPDWAKVLAIIGLLPWFFGPILTLIVVYVSQGGRSRRRSRR